MKSKYFLASVLTLVLVLTACNNKEKDDSITEGGMKCGPGKCGASMVDGSAVLVKKKMNILDQLQEDDNRRECVLNANSTKTLYNCVRVEATGRLSTKCSLDNTQKDLKMKCEAGKCSTGKVTPKKEEKNTMKCQAGKCGDM